MLTVTGIVRGAPLSADLLVHWTGLGELSDLQGITAFGILPILSAPVRSTPHIPRTQGTSRLMSLRNVTTKNPTTWYQQTNWTTWPTSRLGLPKKNSMSVQWLLVPGRVSQMRRRARYLGPYTEYQKVASAYQAAWLIDEDAERGSEREWINTSSDDGGD